MCIFGDDDLYNPMNAFPDFECETEEEAREWFDSYNGFADDEDEYYDDWADESLKEDIDISTYKEVSPENRGGTIYRLFRKVENGKGKWAAIEQCNGKDCGEPFEITYEQARGFEPMNSNEKIGMVLGKKLLPRNEELSKDAIKAATLMQKVFREYPDISEEDEDYLTSLSYKGLVKEIRNRGWDEILKLDEDTVKQGKHWVNKGDSGKTHGKFATKKAADAQRKAMFANGYKAESLNEESSDSIGIFHNDNGIDYDIIERSESGKNLLLRHPRGSKWIVAWNCPRDNQGSWGQGHYFFDEMSARKLWNKEYANK